MLILMFSGLKFVLLEQLRNELLRLFCMRMTRYSNNEMCKNRFLNFFFVNGAVSHVKFRRKKFYNYENANTHSLHFKHAEHDCAVKKREKIKPNLFFVVVAYCSKVSFLAILIVRLVSDP